MQSISTRFLAPTNRRGSRIKATSSGGLSITLDWEDADRPELNHGRAAKALIRKMGWGYRAWFAGGMKGGGYIWVCAHPDEAITFSPEQSAWVEQSPRQLDIDAAFEKGKRP